MYLLLDNSSAQEISIYLWLNNKWVQYIYPTGTDSLVAVIDKCLQAEKCTLKDLEGIAVLIGKGSFTSTRIAVTVANTLSYVLGVPVVSTTSVEDANLIAKIKNANKGVLVSAVYSGEPNIGKKRT